MLPKCIKSTEETCEIMSKQTLRTYTEYECLYFIGFKIQMLQRYLTLELHITFIR